jgi:hypothetical protein
MAKLRSSSAYSCLEVDNGCLWAKRLLLIVSADMNTTAAVEALLSRLDKVGTEKKDWTRRPRGGFLVAVCLPGRRNFVGARWKFSMKWH